MPSDTLTSPTELVELMPQPDGKDSGSRDHKQDQLIWPTSPTNLRSPSDSWTILELLFDLVLATLAIPFFILGILARLADGKSVEIVPYTEGLLSASRFVSTLIVLRFSNMILLQTIRHSKALLVELRDLLSSPYSLP